MSGPWERIEGSSRDDELDRGVQARIADPLWMLARQWQTGELRGDDAAQPAAVQLRGTSTTLQSYRAGSGPARPIPTGQPLERVVEAAPPPGHGSAGLYWAARTGGLLTRRLRRAGLGEAAEALIRAFVPPKAETVALPGAGQAAVALLQGRALDGRAVLKASQPALVAAMAEQDAPDRTAALDVIASWRKAVSRRMPTSEADTWDDTRQEHRFSVAASDGTSELVLSASGYVGGHLDWYSFDVDPKGTHELKSGSTRPFGVSTLPTPVEYSGMPAPRWWAFENGDVHFGDISAGPGDLARLMLADFATVYGDDWYSVPLRLPIGSLSRVDGLVVFDSMGLRHDIEAAALQDARNGSDRVFRLFEMQGDPSVPSGRAPLLFIPPTLSGSHIGEAVESLELVRDEGANLAWGIERRVEGPLGRPVDRLQHWRTVVPLGPRAAGGAGGGTGPANADPAGRGVVRHYQDEAWVYRLEASAPPFWIPFTPVPVGTGFQMRLRRSRMQLWDLLPRALVGPKGELLRPDRPLFLEEEEVLRGGIAVERRWQVARWVDGSLHVWLQRSKRMGRGERSSGVRWDLIEGEVQGD